MRQTTSKMFGFFSSLFKRPRRFASVSLSIVHSPLLHFYRLILLGGNRKIEDAQRRRRQNKPKTFWLGEHNNTNWFLLRRFVCRHQFQVSFISTTWHLVSSHSHFAFSQKEKKMVILLHQRKMPPQQGHILGGQTTIFALQMISFLFIYMLGQLGWVNASVWSVAFRSEIESQTIACFPNLFRFNAVPEKGCAAEPSWAFSQMLQRSLFWWTKRNQIELL